MSSPGPSSSVTFRSLDRKLSQLAELWISGAAFGCLTAAEIFAPDYRKTAAEKLIMDPEESDRKRKELHDHRQRISGAIERSNKIAAEFEAELSDILLRSPAANAMQTPLFQSLFSTLEQFIRKMHQAEQLTREAASQREQRYNLAQEVIRRFSKSELEMETELGILAERSQAADHLFEPEVIDGTLSNNNAMLQKMMAIRTKMQDYAERNGIKV